MPGTACPPLEQSQLFKLQTLPVFLLKKGFQSCVTFSNPGLEPSFLVASFAENMLVLSFGGIHIEVVAVAKGINLSKAFYICFFATMQKLPLLNLKEKL